MKRALFLFLILLLALPLMAQATVVDDGTSCPASAAGGHFWQFVSSQEPNCRHGWIETYRCDLCGKTSTSEYGEPGDHQFGAYQRIEPTCTQYGGTRRVCAVCGFTEEMWEIEPLGHDWVESLQEPTCTQDGYRSSACSRCGERGQYTTISAKGHTPVSLPAVEATCTSAGKTEGSRCSVCGTMLNVQADVPALGHSWDGGTVTKAASCTADGVITFTCSRCGATRTEAIAKTGHTPVTVPGKAASCTANGLTDGQKCSVCGTVIKAQSQIPATGHTWGDWRTEAPGTCVQRGMQVRACSRCGTEEYRYADYGPHDWGEWATVKEPTATEAGLEERVCKNDASHKEQREIPVSAIAAAGNPELWFRAAYDSRSYAVGEQVEIQLTVKNTGDVALAYVSHESPIPAQDSDPLAGLPATLAPGEEWKAPLYVTTASQADKDDPEAQMPGTFSRSFFITYTDGAHPVAEEQFVREQITDADAPKPSLSFTATWAENAGVGKRVEGAIVYADEFVTNTGNCDVYVLATYIGSQSESVEAPHSPGDGLKSDSYRLAPGEMLICHGYHYGVTKSRVEAGEINEPVCYSASYVDREGNWKKITSNGFLVLIPLTYPEGDEPEAPNPSLTLIDEGDCYYKGGAAPEIPTTGDIFDPDDGAFVNYTLINSGNVPLSVFRYCEAENIQNQARDLGVFPSGKSYNNGFGDWTISVIVVPGTGTDDLLGIANVSFYFVGCDPETGEELCRTQTITRSWKVRKPGPAAWEIPEESNMSAKLTEYTSFADPLGYQLGEHWTALLTYRNTGNVDIPSYSVYDPYDGFTGTYGELKTGESNIRGWTHSVITQEDVERGYIYLPPVQITWTDPDSGNERIAFSNSLTLKVISKKGLLLNKVAVNAPVNAQYYTEGEQIEWKITVTNNSDAPYTDVTVTDQGVVVGHFDVIAPGESVTCSPAPTTVTEYDQAVTYITNIASVTGTDENGDTHTENSNIVSVPTSENSSVSLPHTSDPKGAPRPGDPAPGQSETPEHPGSPGGGLDPSGPIHGVSAGATIYKTTAHGPANGDWFALGEAIDYVITVKNIGDVALENVTVTDSLGGFAPIGSAGSIAPGAEQSFPYQHTVTQSDMDKGYVVNSAVAAYTFGGGIPAAPIQSNPVYSKAGENGYIPGEGMPGGDGISSLIPPVESHFDPSKLPAPGPGYTPVIGPDGKPVTTPDGKPIYTDGHGGYIVIGPDGRPILCDEHGTPILDENGNFIYPLGNGPISCEYRLDALGQSEAHFTLHACAEHTAAAQAAETASANGTAEGWKQAGDIWRAEIDKLYQTLYDAADDEAKAALIQDRLTLDTYLDTYEAMRAGDDPAAAQQAVAEMLRLRCAELCAMAHTAPAQLPDSLLGNYARMFGGDSYEVSSREIAALEGSDSPVTERYDAALSRTLGEVVDTVQGTGSAGQANAFVIAQRQWQIALDSIVNAYYKAADKETRKLIAGNRVMLDQVFAARKDLLTLLYENAPQVSEEALMNLYKNAALDASAK